MPLDLADVSIGLLTLDKVAEQLAFAFPPTAHNYAVFVQRLIARGALKAVQYGEESVLMAGTGPKLRVRLEDLKAFIASNGQSFEEVRKTLNIPPETMTPIFALDSEGFWFTNPWCYEVEKLGVALRNELQTQLDALVEYARATARGEYPDPKTLSPELRSLALKLESQLHQKMPDAISATVSISPQIQQLIDTPADARGPGSFLNMPTQKPDTSAFLNMTEILLCAGLLAVTKEIIHTSATSNQSAIQPEDSSELYKSPQEYQRIRDGALGVFLSRNALVASTRVAFALGGPFNEIPVTLSVGNGALMQAARSNGARLASLAF